MRKWRRSIALCVSVAGLALVMLMLMSRGAGQPGPRVYLALPLREMAAALAPEVRLRAPPEAWQADGDPSPGQLLACAVALGESSESLQRTLGIQVGSRCAKLAISGYLHLELDTLLDGRHESPPRAWFDRLGSMDAVASELLSPEPCRRAAAYLSAGLLPIDDESYGEDWRVIADRCDQGAVDADALVAYSAQCALCLVIARALAAATGPGPKASVPVGAMYELDGDTDHKLKRMLISSDSWSQLAGARLTTALRAASTEVQMGLALGLARSLRHASMGDPVCLQLIESVSALVRPGSPVLAVLASGYSESGDPDLAEQIHRIESHSGPCVEGPWVDPLAVYRMLALVAANKCPASAHTLLAFVEWPQYQVPACLALVALGKRTPAVLQEVQFARKKLLGGSDTESFFLAIVEVSLGATTPDALRALKRYMLPWGVDRASEELLRVLGPPEALGPLLLEMLSTGNGRGRGVAMRLLPGIRPTREAMIAALIPILEDESTHPLHLARAVEAVRVLGEGASAALPALNALTLRAESSLELRYRIGRAIQAIQR